MCAVSGVIIKTNHHRFWDLLKASEIRGQDGTGLVGVHPVNGEFSFRSKKKASLSQLEDLNESTEVCPGTRIIAQNRLAIFGLSHENDQPLVGNVFALVHNGNLVGFEPMFEKYKLRRELQVDSELLLRMIDAEERKYSNVTVFDISNILNVVRGNMACLALDLEFATLYAFKRDKPLYSFEDEDGLYFFSTERIGRKVFGNQPFKEFKENEIQCYA